MGDILLKSLITLLARLFGLNSDTDNVVRLDRRHSSRLSENSKPAKEKRNVTIVYEARPRLVSRPELATLLYLKEAVSNQGHVFACVRIADIIKVSAGGDHIVWRKAFNPMAMKHVDFVVTGPLGEICFAVEVDDSSHRDPKRQARDAYVNDIFRKAGLPLVRFEPGDEAKSVALKQQLERFSSVNDLIPICIDHHSCAQSRYPMDMMRQGASVRLFQARQQMSSMAS